ncbi:hypothetical protein Tco_1538422 [Tanacetum coccineum]
MEDRREDEEEEEHLAPADSTTVVPADEPVFPPEGTEPIIPPPSTDITIGARIKGTALASFYRFTTTVTSPLLTISIHAKSLLTVRDDIPELSSLRQEVDLSTIGSNMRSERIYVDIPEVKGYIMVLLHSLRCLMMERRQGLEMLGTGLGILGCSSGMEAGQYGWLEEEAYASREAWARSIGLSQATHQELQTHRDHVYAHETYLQAHQTQLQLQSTLIQTQHQVHETRFHMQQTELAAFRETDRRRQDQMVETLRVIRDMRREMSDMQAELLALRESRVGA